ncbi:MAG: hypothetical protein ABIY51_00680 [Ferruginibacter sp.]
MKIILTINVLLFQLGLVAQPKFEHDPNYCPQYKFVDSVFNLKATNDFEFRFCIRHSGLFGGNSSIIIISENDNKWKANIYNLSFFPVESFLEDTQNLPNPLLLWKKLLKQKVLTLPDNSLLRTKDGKIPYSNTRDGTTYTFELITKAAKRSYSYYAPYGAIEEYPEIKEFKSVLEMVFLIERFYRTEYR